ncbi:MAG: nucleotidyl transferase AbiEii/AbiGii toxin family protein, partial [bacterium]
MSSKSPAVSTYNRLSKLAKESKRPFDELLLYYGMERFLYRLSQSKFAEKFILKGALMFHVWDSKNVRATRDIDFLGYFENELDSVATIIREICETESNDGLIFDSKNLKTLRIKEDAEYE